MIVIVFGLPGSGKSYFAQASGCVDFVMPLNKIPDKLKSLAAALKT